MLPDLLTDEMYDPCKNDVKTFQSVAEMYQFTDLELIFSF